MMPWTVPYLDNLFLKNRWASASNSSQGLSNEARASVKAQTVHKKTNKLKKKLILWHKTARLTSIKIIKKSPDEYCGDIL